MEFKVSSVMLLSVIILALFSHSLGVVYYIDDSTGLERVFDGIGGLSGGGATSKLLVNYPVQQRNEILDYLFKPNFGASLHICKVEIGGDAQSTEGTESSHMHEPWDLNYHRGYEWWLMTEAKKRNPAIKLYGLSWAYPGWLGQEGNDDPYIDAIKTATYIVKWLQGARSVYKLEIDYIGIWNERGYNSTYIKVLRSVLDKFGFHKTQVVAADGGWDISIDMLKDIELSNSVQVIGSHYPGTTASREALSTGKSLWASEDYSTFNDLVGGGCWARILNQNYVNGYMTSTISWNLVAAYYPDLPYNRCGLMTAQEPWGGYYQVNSPIWISAHSTQFTAPGWRYFKHGSGVGKLVDGGSYVTLTGTLHASTHYTFIIETMSRNNSVCIRPFLPEYTVKPQIATFQLQGSAASISALFVWYSHVGSNNTMLFEARSPLQVVNGMVTVELGVDEVWTLSTYGGAVKGAFNSTVPSSAPFPATYSDDFESYPLYSEAYNFVPQTGVWEVLPSSVANSKGQKVNTQVLLHKPVYWCDTGDHPLNLGGNYNWSDVSLSVDVAIPSVNGTLGVCLAARINNGGCTHARDISGVFFWVFPVNQTFQLTRDSGAEKLLLTGPLTPKMTLDAVYTMSMTLTGSTVKGLWGTSGHSTSLFSYGLPSIVPTNGFVGYGTANFSIAEFDNFKVLQAVVSSKPERSPGYAWQNSAHSKLWTRQDYRDYQRKVTQDLKL